MDRKQYSTKWGIVYKGKCYMQVYGKKKAYELLYRLSYHIGGLSVEHVSKNRTDAQAEQKVCGE